MSMGRERILIVEDEGLVAVNTKLTLISLQYEVLPIAISAKSAIELCKEERPDLVLMDIRLRGKRDGIEAASHIWENYKIPSVFVSAYATEDVLKRMHGIIHFGFLKKPVEEWQLRPAIEAALDKCRVSLSNK